MNDKTKQINNIVIPELELNPIVETSKYGNIRQDNIINALSLVSSKTAASIDEITGAGLIDINSGVKTITSIEIMIQKFSNTTLKQSTSKLLTLFNMEFTQSGANDASIAIPLKDVADRLGLKNINKARETIKKDLEALYNISLEAQRTAPSGKTDYIKFRICEAQGIAKGVVCFKFTDAIANHLRKGNIMPVNYKLLQIESNSNKNPYAYPLGLKITQLMKMNQFNNETQKPNTTCIISVSKLLEVCHNYGMPTYEELAASTRNYEKQIIMPLIRDLDRLAEEKIFKWEFCKSKDEMLTDEELETYTAKDYIDLYVKITYPEDYERDEYDAKKANKSDKEAKKKNKVA